MEWLSTYDAHAHTRASRISLDIYGERRPFEYMTKEHCVEVYSWALPDKDTLRCLTGFLHGTRVFDPIAGSGFHAKLFSELGVHMWCADIQPDPDSWVPVHEHDAMAYDWGKDGGSLWLSFAPGNTHDDPEGNVLLRHCVKLRKWRWICLAGNYRNDELAELDSIPYSKHYMRTCVQPWGERVKFRLYSRDTDTYDP